MGGGCEEESEITYEKGRRGYNLLTLFKCYLLVCNYSSMQGRDQDMHRMGN